MREILYVVHSKGNKTMPIKSYARAKELATKLNGTIETLVQTIKGTKPVAVNMSKWKPGFKSYVK